MWRKFYGMFVGVCAVAMVSACGAPEMVPIGESEMGDFAEADSVESDVLEENPMGNTALGSQTPKYIQVYVCGAVVRPGLYTVMQDSRVAVALEAAGGFMPDAGRDSVNLADWLKDGQMVYFPTCEEEQQTKLRTVDAQTGMVNINTASAEVLSTLPGIGESKAADIISYRESNGKYHRTEDIMKVPGIKENLYAKIRERIVVE